MTGAPNFLLIEKNGNGSRTLFEGGDLEEVRDYVNLKIGDEPTVDLEGETRRRRSVLDLHPYVRRDEL